MGTGSRKFWIAAALALGSMMLLSCGDPADNADELASELEGLDEPDGLATEAPKAIEDVAVGDESTEPDEAALEDGVPVTYKITTQKYTASASYDTQVLLNPSTDVVYPGSVLLGHTIDDGSYQEVVKGTKNPVTISYSLTGVEDDQGRPGKVSGTIVPTLSAFRALHSEIMSQVIPGQSTTYSYEKIEIDDKEEFDLKFRAAATYGAPTIEASVETGFDFSRGNTSHKFMIRFMQTFYTVDIDQGEGTFLYKTFDLDDFGGYRPVYVSSLAYGRLAFLTIESTEEWTTIDASLNVVFDSPTTSVDAALDAAMDFLNSKTTTNITVIGASTVATTLEEFVDLLKNGGLSSTNPGAIVAYKLRFVHDNAVANTVFNGEYTIRQVTRVLGGGVDVTLQLVGIDSQCSDGGGNAKYYGTLRFTDGVAEKTLWSYSSADPCAIPDIGYTAWSGAAHTVNFATANDSFQVVVTGLGEYDPLGGDESFDEVNGTYIISDIESGTAFRVRSALQGDSSEWVEFDLLPTITYLY